MDFPLKEDGQKLFGPEVRKLRRDVLTSAGEYLEATGSSNAFVLQIDSNEDTGVDGEKIDPILPGHVFRFKANHTITGPATLTVKNNDGTDLLTTVSIKKNLSENLTGFDILEDQIVIVVYDGTNFQIPSNINKKWGGTGADGAVDGSENVTIAGSDNTYIVKNYTSWAADQGGGKTLSITPTNCILHIKIQGDADFTDWDMDFAGKGAPGGIGGTGNTGSAGNDGTNGTDPSGSVKFSGGGKKGVGGTYTGSNGSGGKGGGGGANLSTGPGNSASSGGEGGLTPLQFILAAIQGRKCIIIAPGGGGGGGGGGSADSGAVGDGGDGGDGGGCVIFEIGGNVTFSGTTATVAGINGSNGTNGTGTDSGGGGGGGGGAAGILAVFYGGTKTGSLTPTVTAGIGGTKGTSTGAPATDGANGAVGDYIIEKNVTFT
jgi:hypothetical protein